SMFMQVEAHSTHTKGGLGIGLTLVERLVRLHDGEIVARSDGPGKGSEFEVILPCVKSRSAETETNDSFTGAVKSKRVLVVDDNADVTEMLAILLQNSGHETLTASNGQDAIEIFKRFKPDFAVLDIGMPDIDGYQLCRILRALPEARHTIFFSQSGWGNKEFIDKAFEAGFAQHFVKPLEFSVLEQAIDKYSEGRDSP